MGYDQDIFLGDVDEDFICSICLGVFQDPVANDCNHRFCKKCLQLWANMSKTCPYCRKNLITRYTKTLPRDFTERLGNLFIKCANSNCTSVIRLKEKFRYCRACRYGYKSQSQSYQNQYAYTEDLSSTKQKILVGIVALVSLVLIAFIKR